MNWDSETLKMLALSQTEAMILNSLKEAKGIQEIARDTRLSRTGINYAIKNLQTRGLLNFLKVGKRRAYIALNLKQTCKQFQQTLDELMLDDKQKLGARIRTSRENEFIIHVGAGEIIPAYKRIALENKNERVRAIQHHRSWLEIVKKLSIKQLAEFNEAIKSNRIIIDGILNKSAYRDYAHEVRADPNTHKELVASLEGRMADYTVFPDNIFNYDAEIWLFKNTTLIINWHEEVAIEITNSSMTSFIKDMFEYVKVGSQKIDHNKAVREILK